MSSASLRYTVLLEWNEEEDGIKGGYTVTVPALPGCISEGEIREEALENIEEAIACYLESLKNSVNQYRSIPQSQ